MRQFTHWKWRLDEVYVKVRRDEVPLASRELLGVLESFVTTTRDKSAALKFMKKLMKRHGTAKTITTDGLRSYRAAMKDLGCEEKQEVGRWANNRVENAHQPFRRMKTLQQFALTHASFHNHFNQERHLVSRDEYKTRRSAALAEWKSLMA
jgi:putative transposase